MRARVAVAALAAGAVVLAGLRLTALAAPSSGQLLAAPPSGQLLAAPSSGQLLAAPSSARAAHGALPALGVRLSTFPEGEGRAIAEKACLQCHSADIPRQQRLTEKQWTAEVEKMIRWGAEMSAPEKTVLAAYLSSHFGPENDSFHPLEVRPSAAAHPSSPRRNAEPAPPSRP